MLTWIEITLLGSVNWRAIPGLPSMTAYINCVIIRYSLLRYQNKKY